MRQYNESIPLTEEEKQEMIEKAAVKYGEFLTELGFDWQNDEHAKNTPMRVAKAWVNDLVSGSYNEPPDVASFPNTDDYSGMVIQRKIPFTSICAHHNLPFFGHAHVAYIPGKNSDSKVIGLSKLNRVVAYFAQRPNVQESLTKQIHDFINTNCVGNRGVAVVMSSQHMCCGHRGIRHRESEMTTSSLSGYFFNNEVGTRTEFFSLINNK